MSSLPLALSLSFSLVPTFPCIALRLLNSQRSPLSIIFHNSTSFRSSQFETQSEQKKNSKKNKKTTTTTTTTNNGLATFGAFGCSSSSHGRSFSSSACRCCSFRGCASGSIIAFLSLFFPPLPAAPFLTSSLFCKLCFYPKHTYTHYVIVFLLGSWLLLRYSLSLCLCLSL